jgi:hypothetical protein
MAKSSRSNSFRSASNRSIMLRVSRSEAAEKIQQRIHKGEELLLKLQSTNGSHVDDLKNQYERWLDYNKDLLIIFSKLQIFYMNISRL